MKKLDIACDIDGVLADFCGAATFKLRELGIDVQSEDLKHWDFNKALGIVGPVAERLARAPRFARLIDPYPGAVVAYLKLCKLGNVYALTAPMKGSEDWYALRVSWLRDHLCMPEERIVFLAGPDKWRFRADVLIEDHPVNAAKWCEAHPWGECFIIDRPWNREGSDCYADHRRMTRTTLEELPALVQLLAEAP